MDKEILEITKKFHDTYEKLASEYTYETREETRVFDINSSNGKLMYATVNEVIKPILEENQELKSQLKGTTHCFDEEEHEKLKKQVEEYQKELEKADSITQSCIFNGKKDSSISYRKCLNMLENLQEENEQLKEQIKDIDLWNNKYNEEFNKNRMLEHNWNKLEEFIRDSLEAIDTIQKLTGNAIENYTPRILTYNQIKNKMQELEKSDSNE